MLERDVLRQVKDYLKIKGWRVIRLQQGPLCERGLPDLMILKDGKWICLEVKSSKGKLSPYQEQFRRDIQDHKGTYLWVSSLDQLREVLEY